MNALITETPRTGRRRSWLVGTIVAVVCAVVALVLVLTMGGTSSSGTGSSLLVLSPAPGSSPYHDGQQIEVSVGPNKRFIPYSRIILIQCSDPGGQGSRLPVSDAGCDGNTVPGYSTLVNKDGSFSGRFTIHSLPNTLLGEPADQAPVCNVTHTCVLFVGEDQTHFNQPKVFSEPFNIVPSHTPKVQR